MSIEDKTFDNMIIGGKNNLNPPIKNIAEMIFNTLPHRKEQCNILIGQDEDHIVKISLEQFRCIIANLYKIIKEKKIHPNDTVLLTSLSINNELLIVLLFCALVSYGCRVFLPMYVETKELEYWIKIAKCNSIIIPENEIVSINDSESKKIIQEIRSIAVKHKVNVFDVEKDFKVKELLYEKVPFNSGINNDELVKWVISNTNLETDAVLFTTSGTTGRSKLVLYDQRGFVNNCMCWQESGLFKKDKMGGISLIDIFPHTISVRAVFNAIWTGFAVSIMISTWVKKRPEKILPFLIEVKPQIITMGPSSIKFIVELIKLIPELKNLVFSELHAVVSTGAVYSLETARDMENILSLPLYNAYGTTETQQVLTTVLCEKLNEETRASLGCPLYGVDIGLISFTNNFYKLYVKSPFGHKNIIGEDTEYSGGYYYTGDIVKYENDRLFYISREHGDFFKNGYGAKVPISAIENHYSELMKRAEHIEFFNSETLNFSFGISALIFIKNSTIPKGRVKDKKIIQEYYTLIKNINLKLVDTIEPFTFEHWAITRFLLINDEVFKTNKGTISRFKIVKYYESEIYDLLHSHDKKSGVRLIQNHMGMFIDLLLKSPLLHHALFRRLLLKMYVYFHGKIRDDNIA